MQTDFQARRAAFGELGGIGPRLNRQRLPLDRGFWQRFPVFIFRSVRVKFHFKFPFLAASNSYRFGVLTTSHICVYFM